VRPKWEFSQALKVFHSEFKAKGIQFHYAMDHSFDDLAIDYVVADLNRMKQGGVVSFLLVARLIETVLVNLITNAIKFTARKVGERKIIVSLGASWERPTSYPPNVIFFGQDEVGQSTDNHVEVKEPAADVVHKESFHIDSTTSADWGSGPSLYLMVAVKDTGIGIGRDDQVKLFERFRCVIWHLYTVRT
jgi:signal transduction histidine kinase